MLVSKTNLPKSNYKLSHHTKTNTRYPYNDTMNLGSRAHQTAQNYAIYKASDADASKTRNDHEDNNTDEELSPTWRAREIERGRIELMEKVKSMPESCYELSLKDIVEKPVVYQGSPTKEQESPRESVLSSHVSNRQGSGSFKRRSDVKSQMMMRNGSIGSGGLLLKMVFPIPMGPGNSINNNKTSRLSTSSSAKVSPRPSYSDESEKDWVRKTFSPRENGKPFFGSTGKTKSSTRNKDKIGTRQGNGCGWPFFWAKRSKLKG